MGKNTQIHLQVKYQYNKSEGKFIEINPITGFSSEGTEALHKRHAGKIVIELELNSLTELYNSFDPSPFHEKDLDPDVEEYIFNAVDEFPLKKPLKILIHLPAAEVDAETELNLKKAIRNNFSYKKLLAQIELKRLLHQGRTNLMIVLVFFLCILATQLVSKPPSLLKRIPV